MTAKQWIEDGKKDVLALFKSQGRSASGGFEKDLESFIDVKPEITRVGLRGSYYTYWLENGRKPNKDKSKLRLFAAWASNKNDGFIYKWCNYKGINTKFAFPIAYKIGDEGYKGQKLIEDVFTEDKIRELKDIIAKDTIVKLNSEVVLKWRQ